jgi:predicted ATPase/transcriptional regulator with XRE-family HTH domain
MPSHYDPISTIEDFGSLLKYLRRRARITQKELSIALGYSESQISRLESNDRAPDKSAIKALFITPLGLEREPEIVTRLLALAEKHSEEAVKRLPSLLEAHDALFEQSLLSKKGNLPKVLSSFVGREREIEQVCELLGSQTRTGSPALRMLTLTGSGGVGKTRLSIHVGEVLEQSQPDGVWMVELAPLVESNLVPHKLMQIFDLPSDSPRPNKTVLIEYLQTKRMILVLDNCEHLIEAASELTKELLENCPGLQILATSREPLGVPGEVTYRVPSLTLSNSEDSGERDVPNAVRLFLDRAQSVQHDFTLSPANLPVIAQICRRLDGIPLAIELAAARMNALSVEAISARLDDAFHLLTSGGRAFLSRQQSLRASINWSYVLLSPAEKKLLMRFSVFAGRWSLEAAEMICADENAQEALPRAQVFDILAQLVNKSLVVADIGYAEPRYHLHEIIRQFAQEHLRQEDDFLSLYKRHLDYYLLLCETSESYLRGSNQVTLIDRLEEELDNIRAALAFSLREPGMAENGLRLATALRWFWDNRNLQLESLDWFEKLLAVCPSSELTWPIGVAARASALAESALIRRWFGEMDNQRLLEESHMIYQSLGSAGKAGMVWLLNVMEISAYWSGDMQRGRQLSAEALALAEELGDRFYLAEVLDNSLSYASNPDEELQIVERSLSLRRSLGDVNGIYSTLYFRSHIYSRMGDDSQALEDAREAMKYARISKNQRGIPRVLFSMGRFYFAMGNIRECFLYFHQALAMVRLQGEDSRFGNWLIQVVGMAAWLEATTGQGYGAEKYLVEALDIAHKLSNATIEAEATFYQAELVGLHGESHKAERYFRTAGSLFAKFDGPRAARLSSYSLGKAALLNSEWKVAGKHFLAGLRSTVEQKNQWDILHTMAALAVAKVSCQGEEELAVRLQGTVDAMRPVTQNVDPSIDLLYLPFPPQTVLAHARNVLGEMHCAAAYAIGQSMTLEQAAASVLA